METSKLTFLSGLDTIGSNIISIENSGYRVIMDFGALNGVKMEEMLNTTLTKTLYDNDKLPKIESLYWPQNQSLDQGNTIICLSHLHIDHIGSLKHLASDTPIYALNKTKPFLKTLVENHLLPDYQFDIRPVEEGVAIHHGPFTIRFFESDHDTLGIASIFIELPDLKIIHSGDLRLTGFHPEQVLKWAMAARQWEPDILLLEGTTFSHIGEEPNPISLKLASYTQDISALTELALHKKIAQLLDENSKSLFAFNGYPQNVERLIKVMRLMNHKGRRFIVLPEYFSLIKDFLIDGDQVEVFSQEIAKKIKENPQDYALQVDEERIELLQDLPQGLYLHSNATPLGPYMDNYESFIMQVVNYGWEFYLAEVSGHALPDDLLMLAYLIQAKVTVPWHTYQRGDFAEALVERGLEVWCPEQGKQYSSEIINRML